MFAKAAMRLGLMTVLAVLVGVRGLGAQQLVVGTAGSQCCS